MMRKCEIGPYHYNRRDNKIWIRWYFRDTFSRHIQVQDCYSGGCEFPSHFHTSHCTRSIRSTRSTHHPLMKNCLKDIVFSFKIDHRSRRSVLMYFFNELVIGIKTTFMTGIRLTIWQLSV